MLPFLFFEAQFDLVRVFLSCFEKTEVAMYIQIVTTIMHAFTCFIFVNVFNWGIEGAATASAITAFTNLVAIHIYVTYFLPELKEAWTLPNWDSLKGLGTFVKTVFPAMLLLCIEWWTFEFQTFLSSRISVDAIAA